jgi:hypothetical protein
VAAVCFGRRYGSLKSPALLVRLDHVASFIVNVDHGIMRTAAMHRVADCIADRRTTADPTAAHQKSDRRRDDLHVLVAIAYTTFASTEVMPESRM